MLAPPATLIALLKVKSPYRVLAVFANDPVYVPLKIKLLIWPPVVIIVELLPATISKLMLLASVGVPALIVLEEDPTFVSRMSGVPVTENVVAPVKTVPVLFKEIVFVPNARVPVNPVIVSV